MPRKSAKAKKAMGNKKKHVKGNKCQSTMLCDSQSVNQGDILLMEELAKAYESNEFQTSLTKYCASNMDPEQPLSKEGSVEEIPDGASEASTNLMGSDAMNQAEVLVLELGCQAKDSGALVTKESASNADFEQLISKKDGAECASVVGTGLTEALYLGSDSSSCTDYSECETEDYSLCLEAGRGVNIVSVSGRDDDGQRYQLNEAALAALLARPGVADLPVVIISVAGAFRGGKSFLMGFLLRYLYAQARGDEDWLGSDDEPLAGFSWRGGCERETTGLVMWSQPVPITLPSGEQVAVLLLDSQGAFDAQSSLRDSSLVFALSTLLASSQLYNLSQRIGEDDLQHLQVFTEYAALGGALPALTLLVRDWSAPYEHAYGAAGGAAYLRDKLMVRPEQPRELREVRARLASSFERVDCFLLPHPGLRAAQDPSFRGRLHELEEGFKQSLRELAPRLLAPTQLSVKRAAGGALRARDLPALLRGHLAELARAGTTPRSILRASRQAEWLVGAATARATLARAAPRAALPRAALARLLQAARDAALAPVVPLAARAGQDRALTELRQELDDQITRLTEENEVKIELAVARARETFERAARELEREDLCMSRAALTAALAQARARAAARLERAAGPGNLPERAQLAEELEERVATLLPRLAALNAANNEAALRDAAATLRRALPAAPCARADLAAAHAAARFAAQELFRARRNHGDHEPAACAQPDDDEYTERLQKCIDAAIRNNEMKNDTNNSKEVSASLIVYDEYVNLDRGCWTPQQLDRRNEEGQKAALEHFYSRREGPGGRESDGYVKDLESKLNHRYNNLCEENKTKNLNAVNAALKVFNDTMDASCKGLKMSLPDLAHKHNDAFAKGYLHFLSKRANSLITDDTSDDEYANILKKRMVDRFEYYSTKNGMKLSKQELAAALAGTGLVVGGVVAGAAWLAAAAASAVASRVGTAAVFSIGASLLNMFKK